MLSLPLELRIEALIHEASTLVVTLSTTTETAPCTRCQTLAWRVHSRYVRTLADLPSSGQAVTLRWQVRKWFCPNPACERKIFTEQLPTFTAPSARMTQRLITALQAIAGACGGALGSRLATRLSMPASSTTLLRRFLALPVPEQPPVNVLGVDDWAWKKGRRYGTLVVDHERACIYDLLSERSADAFATWLAAHPSVDVITRDRSPEYAKAATAAAPQAEQVADRYHLVRNARRVARAPPGPLSGRDPQGRAGDHSARRAGASASHTRWLEAAQSRASRTRRRSTRCPAC